MKITNITFSLVELHQLIFLARSVCNEFETIYSDVELQHIPKTALDNHLSRLCILDKLYGLIDDLTELGAACPLPTDPIAKG